MRRLINVQVFGRRQHRVLRALSEPASKKRQGTKSREVGQRLGVERYGELMLAPSSIAGATPGRRELHACRQERAREWEKRLGRRLEGVNGRRAPG